MSFGPTTPVLRSFDETKAREFYLGFLGFSIDFEHRYEPGMPLYMGISRGDCRIHLTEHHGDGCPGACVRIETDELEAYQAGLVAQDYKYYRPGLTDTEWGTREMSVHDPFGNHIIFFRTLAKG